VEVAWAHAAASVNRRNLGNVPQATPKLVAKAFVQKGVRETRHFE
jgi:hypothetical protein